MIVTCPKCNSTDVAPQRAKKTHRFNPAGTRIREFTVYPFTCNNCSNTFTTERLDKSYAVSLQETPGGKA